MLQYATLPLIFTPLSYPVYLGVSQALNFGIPLTFLKFSRSAEAEADFLGLQYMYKAGYDPDSYAAFFGKVLQEGRRSPGSVPRIFLDHPPTPERILKSKSTKSSPNGISTSYRLRDSTMSERDYQPWSAAYESSRNLAQPWRSAR